jgi:hypothetical protein
MRSRKEIWSARRSLIVLSGDGGSLNKLPWTGGHAGYMAEKSVDDFVVDWPSQPECSAAQKSVKHTEAKKDMQLARALFCEAQGVCFYSSGVERMHADGKYRFVLCTASNASSRIFRFSCKVSLLILHKAISTS